MPPFVGQVGWMNPITGTEGELTIDQIKSANYLAGALGWIIQKDGNAEFNDVAIRGELLVVNGNSYIRIENDISPDGGPGIFLNPDSSLYQNGLLYAAAGIDPDTASIVLSSPVDLSIGGAYTADFFLSSGYTAGAGKKTLASVNSDHFQVFGGFGFEGAADESRTGANSAAVTPGNALDVLTLTIGAEANCTYAISLVHRGVGFVTPVAFPGNRCQIRITRNGTQIASNQILAGNTTLTQEGGGYTIHDTPGAGSVTYAFNILHDAASTAASVHTVAAADSPCTLSVRGFKANL